MYINVLHMYEAESATGRERRGEGRGERFEGEGGREEGGNGRTMAVLLRGVLDEAHAGPIHLVFTHQLVMLIHQGGRRRHHVILALVSAASPARTANTHTRTRDNASHTPHTPHTSHTSHSPHTPHAPHSSHATPHVGSGHTGLLHGLHPQRLGSEHCSVEMNSVLHHTLHLNT